MNKSAIERHYERLYSSITYQDYPIHFAGASLLLVNDSGALAAIISVSDSDDAIAWTPVLFSTYNQSGLLNITMQPQSEAVILFNSCRKYVRITTTPNIPDGVFFHMVQWPPTKVPCAEYAYA